MIYCIALHLQPQRYLVVLIHRIALSTKVLSRYHHHLLGRRPLLQAMLVSMLPGCLTVACYVAFRLSSSNASLSTALNIGVLVIMGTGSILARPRPSATVARLFESQLPGRVVFAQFGGKQPPQSSISRDFNIVLC
jgi:hypothetical protein